MAAAWPSSVERGDFAVGWPSVVESEGMAAPSPGQVPDISSEAWQFLAPAIALLVVDAFIVCPRLVMSIMRVRA